MRRRRGSILLENVMYVPVLILLLMGTIELARVSYTYYSLQKTLYTIARYVGTRQGVNFCDTADATVQAAKNFAITGDVDNGSQGFIQGLTADQIEVRVERVDSSSGAVGECACDTTGCDTANGGQGPDFIVVSIPAGYPIRLSIPQLPLDPILLRPHVRLPYQGT